MFSAGNGSPIEVGRSPAVNSRSSAERTYNRKRASEPTLPLTLLSRVIKSRVLALVAGLSIAFAHPLLRAGELGTGSDLEALYATSLEANLAGKVVTVTGPVAPSTLGTTLIHEHIFWDEFAGLTIDGPSDRISPDVLRRMQRRGWTIPETPVEREFFNAGDIRLDMIDRMRAGSRVRFNHYNDDEGLASSEIAAFRQFGGNTIVDQTPRGLGRDLGRLKRFSDRTGLMIVAGTGWYRASFVAEETRTLSVDDLTAIMVEDVISGGADGNRAGIIGEIPLDSRSIDIDLPLDQTMSNAEVLRQSGSQRARLTTMTVAQRDAVRPEELYPQEELKVLRAAARASRISGASLSLHVVEPSLSFLPILREEGVDLGRVIVSHAHPIIADREHLSRALEAGLVLEADYQLQNYATWAPMIDLAPVLDGIAFAVSSGRRDQILLSHDLVNKLGYRRFGGGGYATLHNYIFPELLKRGVTPEDLQAIMVDNPRRLLTMSTPQRAAGL